MSHLLNEILQSRIIHDYDCFSKSILFSIHTYCREIFWTDWGQRAKIEKARLDGSGRQTVVSSDVGWPNGLAIDVEGT